MSLRIGPHLLDALETGTFALDGGAMFGIVPKPLWERKIPADARNRIRLAARCLLIRSGGRKVLVDTGLGGRWSARDTDIYAIEGGRTLDDELARVGVGRADITDVILTHLHFDHAGGAVALDEKGREVPAFPNAAYHVQRTNLEWARRPGERDRGSYRSSDWHALEEWVRLHPVDGEVELFPGIWVVPTDGHTTGLQLVRVEGDGEALTYCADLVPTTAHLKPAWNMGYDLRPLVVVEEKKVLVAQALDENGILFFEHDPRVAACRLREDGGEVTVGEVISL